MFDPMSQIPSNDEEAVIALKHGKSKLFGSCLIGIFRCRRARGKSLLDAYKYALLAGIGDLPKGRLTTAEPDQASRPDPYERDENGEPLWEYEKV